MAKKILVTGVAGMQDRLFTAPILFVIFNRPETEQIIFDEIKKIRPKQLFVVADGPRDGKAGEKEKCEAARKIIDQVDWDCEVGKNFSDTNMGCGKRVSSGITWFFENVEKGIILEDDCRPDQSFFPFCAELLERYRDNEKIMMIAGNNIQPFLPEKSESYYFSKIGHVWGWATWRRAWKSYDFKVDGSDFLRKRIAGQNEKYVRFLIGHLEAIRDGREDTWDFQWAFAIEKNYGLSVAPRRNLVMNIGTGSGTHVDDGARSDYPPIIPMKFPLVHPAAIEANAAADLFEQKEILKYYSLKKWLRRFGLFDLCKKLYRFYLSI